MATVRERKIKKCMVEVAAKRGREVPKGRGYNARYERCLLKVECQQKLDPGAKRVNKFAVCHTSVG